LNGRIRVKISRPPKHKKPALNKGRESRAGNCDQGDQDGAGVDADRGKAEDRKQSVLRTHSIGEQGRIKSRAKPDQLVVQIRESKAKERRREVLFRELLL
jgi:hypothetical protein